MARRLTRDIVKLSVTPLRCRDRLVHRPFVGLFTRWKLQAAQRSVVFTEEHGMSKSERKGFSRRNFVKNAAALPMLLPGVRLLGSQEQRLNLLLKIV